MTKTNNYLQIKKHCSDLYVSGFSSYRKLENMQFRTVAIKLFCQGVYACFFNIDYLII